MRRLSLVPVVLVLFGLAGVRPAVAGVAGWSVQLVHADRDSTGTAELHIQGDRFRVSEEGNPQEAIVDSDGVTVVDLVHRTYTVVTYAQMEATLGMMAKVMEGVKETQRQALRDAMKSLPPDQKAQVEKQLASLGSSTEGEAKDVKVTETQDKATIAGLAARKSVISLDGKPALEVWLTPAIPIDPVKQILTRLGKLAPDQAGIQARYVEALEKVDGFPLKVVDLDPDHGGTVMTVTEAVSRDFPDSEFAPPAGFEKTEFNLGDLGK
jgi:hypothetical protein